MPLEFIPVVSGLVLFCVVRPTTHKWRIISAILAGAASSILAGEIFGTVSHAALAIMADSGIVYCVVAAINMTMHRRFSQHRL